jgi:hypothetical protein
MNNSILTIKHYQDNVFWTSLESNGKETGMKFENRIFSDDTYTLNCNVKYKLRTKKETI